MPFTRNDAAPLSIGQHAYALDVSGYTRLIAQIPPDELEDLRTCTERALATGTFAPDSHYRSVRCLYCWGDSFVRLLEHNAIHTLAERMIGRYQLWDEAILAIMPSPPERIRNVFGWHRDFAGPHFGTEIPSYLWFFVCLDDVTPENGATWVVPGSHRLTSKHEGPLDHIGDDGILEQFPSRYQLCGQAGDILVLNPGIIHSPGRNLTSAPRRILLVACCHTAVMPLADHWVIAGPTLWQSASDQVRRMLRGERKALASTWYPLPEGWQTGGDSIPESTAA